jgi:hypothetical protein
MVFSTGAFPIHGTDGTAIGSLCLEAAISFGAPGASAQPMLLQAVITQPAGLQVASRPQHILPYLMTAAVSCPQHLSGCLSSCWHARGDAAVMRRSASMVIGSINRLLNLC